MVQRLNEEWYKLLMVNMFFWGGLNFCLFHIHFLLKDLSLIEWSYCWVKFINLKAFILKQIKLEIFYSFILREYLYVFIRFKANSWLPFYVFGLQWRNLCLIYKDYIIRNKFRRPTPAINTVQNLATADWFTCF